MTNDQELIKLMEKKLGWSRSNDGLRFNVTTLTSGFSNSEDFASLTNNMARKILNEVKKAELRGRVSTFQENKDLIIGGHGDKYYCEIVYDLREQLEALEQEK